MQSALILSLPLINVIVSSIGFVVSSNYLGAKDLGLISYCLAVFQITYQGSTFLIHSRLFYFRDRPALELRAFERTLILSTWTGVGATLLGISILLANRPELPPFVLLLFFLPQLFVGHEVYLKWLYRSGRSIQALGLQVVSKTIATILKLIFVFFQLHWLFFLFDFLIETILRSFLLFKMRKTLVPIKFRFFGADRIDRPLVFASLCILVATIFHRLVLEIDVFWYFYDSGSDAVGFLAVSRKLLDISFVLALPLFYWLVPDLTLCAQGLKRIQFLKLKAFIGSSLCVGVICLLSEKMIAYFFSYEFASIGTLFQVYALSIPFFLVHHFDQAILLRFNRVREAVAKAAILFALKAVLLGLLNGQFGLVAGPLSTLGAFGGMSLWTFLKNDEQE